MLAIQPELVDWGEHPTPAVAAAVPQVAAAVRELIQEWLREA
jgi:hydrogenase maturation protease